jgi:hypothetical protein
MALGAISSVLLDLVINPVRQPLGQALASSMPEARLAAPSHRYVDRLNCVFPHPIKFGSERSLSVLQDKMASLMASRMKLNLLIPY